MARYTGITLGSQIKDGDKGTVFEYELIYFPRSADANSYKIPQPDGVVGTRIRSLGNDKENYRWNFLIKNRRARDDYSAFIDYCKHFNQTGITSMMASKSMWMSTIGCAVWLSPYFLAQATTMVRTVSTTHSFTRPDGRVIFYPMTWTSPSTQQGQSLQMQT